MNRHEILGLAHQLLSHLKIELSSCQIGEALLPEHNIAAFLLAIASSIRGGRHRLPKYIFICDIIYFHDILKSWMTRRQVGRALHLYQSLWQI